MKKQALSLQEAASLVELARGTLTPIKRTKAGKAFYSLQYRRNGRHVSRYVPPEAVEAYREATRNYRLLMEAVDAHVERLSAQTARRIDEQVRRCRAAPGREDKGM